MVPFAQLKNMKNTHGGVLLLASHIFSHNNSGTLTFPGGIEREYLPEMMRKGKTPFLEQ